MPVDRFGKLFFKPPLNPQYNMPINRKPRRKKPWLRYTLIGCLTPIAVILVLIFSLGIYSGVTHQLGDGNPRTDWPTVFSDQAEGNGGTAPIPVSNIWQLSWSCKGPLVVQAIYGVIGVNTIVNTNCSFLHTSGAVQMSQPGTAQVNLRIFSEGSWSVSIQEPPATTQ